jgi:peptidoglycan/LPS O-acetylase OafA/YrhL
MPAALTWLGRISYSTYLLHVPLIAAMWLVIAHTARPVGTVQQLLWMVGFFVVLLTLSQLTYRYVELPMQKLGRRVAHGRLGRSPTPPDDPGGPRIPVQIPAGDEERAGAAG